MKAPSHRIPPKPFPPGISQAKIKLGESVMPTNVGVVKDDYLFMKWGSGTSNFKPKSASEQQTGTMFCQAAEDNGASELLLNFPSHSFKGKLEMIQDDKIHCILYWDETQGCLVLEHVTAQLTRLEKVKKDMEKDAKSTSTVTNGTTTTTTVPTSATVNVVNGTAAVAEKAPLVAEKSAVVSNATSTLDGKITVKPLFGQDDSSDDSDDSSESESDSSMDD